MNSFNEESKTQLIFLGVGVEDVGEGEGGGAGVSDFFLL